MAVEPLKIVVGIKVGGDSESVGAELSVEYHNFSVAQEGAEIFEKRKCLTKLQTSYSKN